MQYEQVDVRHVLVGERHRAVDEAAVQALMRSIAEIGLRTPISVRFLDEATLPDGTVASCVPLLVTGRHRLEAVRRLGETDTLALVIDGDETDARLWEISENLHRAELTVQQRAEHIAEWVRLVEEKAKRPKEEVSDKLSETRRRGRRGGRPGAAAAASRELGVNERDVQRAVKIAGLSDEAKEAAREVGLDDNQSALLRAAARPAEEQAAAIREQAEARSKPKPITPEPEPRAAVEVPKVEVAAQPRPLPDVPTVVADLLARARAARTAWRETSYALSDPDAPGVSDAKRQRLGVAREKAFTAANAETGRCLAQAMAELCRPIAEDLLDLSGHCLGGNLTEEFVTALEGIVRPDQEEKEREDGGC